MRMIIIMISVLCSALCNENLYAMHGRERGKNNFLKNVATVVHRSKSLLVPNSTNGNQRTNSFQHANAVRSEDEDYLIKFGRNSIFSEFKQLSNECPELSSAATASSRVLNSSGDDELSDERKIELTRTVGATFEAKPPKEYVLAVRRSMGSERARRKSVDTFESLLFDAKQPSWVRNGSRVRFDSILTREGKADSARSKRVFSYVYGENQTKRDFIETFSSLYRCYICNRPNVKNTITMALARYCAARAILELKEEWPKIRNVDEGERVQWPEICDADEVERVQRVLKDSHQILIKFGILDPKYHENTDGSRS